MLYFISIKNIDFVPYAESLTVSLSSILQPIHVHFKHFESKDCVKRAADREAWTKVSGQLLGLLRSCATAAREKGMFTEEQTRKYFISGQ